MMAPPSLPGEVGPVRDRRAGAVRPGAARPGAARPRTSWLERILGGSERRASERSAGEQSAEPSAEPSPEPLRVDRRGTDPRASRDGDLRDARLRGLLEIARRLTESLDRREVFRLIVDETNRGLGADGTVMRLLHAESLDIAAWSGIGDATAAPLH